MTDTAPFSERPQDAGSAQLSIATNAPWRPATKTRTKSGPSRDELPKPARPLALLRRHFNCVKCSGRLLPLARVSLRYRSRIRGSFVSSAPERSRRHGAHIVFSVPSVLPSVGPAARLGMLVPEWGFLVQYLFDHILLDRAANDLRHKLNESHIPKSRLDS